MHKAVLTMLLAGAAAATMPSGARAQSTAEAGAGAAAANLSDIIVTASKREERLRDVPAAVTALTAETIERQGIQNFRDYASLVPGLAQRDFGAPGIGTVILRGLNTGPQQVTNTTAFYIDETPFSASGFLSATGILTPDPDIADVERIEVLKGPQGTLYGANSLGGLIRIISARPDTTRLSARARAEVSAIDGGGTGWSLRGTVNVPVIADKLAVRATGFYREAPGFVTNAGTGTRNVNTSTIKGGRLSIRATPTDRLTIDVSGIYQDIENVGAAVQDNRPGTLVPLIGERVYSNVADLPGTLKYRILSGTIDYDLGPGSLVVSGSYGQYRTRLLNDYTRNYIPFLRLAVPALAAIIPANGQAIADISPNMDKYTAEARFVSNRLGAVEFVLGGFYTSEKSRYRTDIFVNAANGTPLPAPFNLLLRALTSSDYREAAAFGNVTVYLGDRLDVTGGLRYAHNDQDAETGGPNAITFYAPRPAVQFKFKDNSTTYLATLRWRPTDTVSAYLRAASGYRPGGPQNNPTPPPGAQTRIDPDTVWNYEAGLKGSFLDGALNFSGSVYRIDWNDIQLNTNFNGIVLQGNGGKARVDGFEVEFQANPARGLTVGGSLGRTNARITEIAPTARASIGANTGDKLPLTPGWTAAVTLDQAWDLANAARVNVGSTLRFQSDMPSSYPGALLDPSIKVPDITTVDLRAGVEFGRFGILARVENLLDRNGITSASTGRLFAGQPVPTVATLIRPRTFTLGVTAAF